MVSPKGLLTDSDAAEVAIVLTPKAGGWVTGMQEE